MMIQTSGIQRVGGGGAVLRNACVFNLLVVSREEGV